jgi:hypothetical protein
VCGRRLKQKKKVEGVLKLKKRIWGFEMRRLLVVRVVVFGGFFFEEVRESKRQLYRCPLSSFGASFFFFL